MIELLVAAAISAVVIGAASGAYVSGMQTSGALQRSRTRAEARIRFEDRMTRLIRAAWIDVSTTPRAKDQALAVPRQIDLRLPPLVCEPLARRSAPTAHLILKPLIVSTDPKVVLPNSV